MPNAKVSDGSSAEAKTYAVALNENERSLILEGLSDIWYDLNRFRDEAAPGSEHEKHLVDKQQAVSDLMTRFRQLAH